MTGKLIDELTRYYGLAIRHNCHSLEAMKNAVMATFYHLQSTDEKPQHDLCPTGKLPMQHGKEEFFVNNYEQLIMITCLKSKDFYMAPELPIKGKIRKKIFLNNFIIN